MLQNTGQTKKTSFFGYEEFQKPGEYCAKTEGFRPKQEGRNLCNMPILFLVITKR